MPQCRKTTDRKRTYVPKIRGCYECSQRRVDCDRGQPGCAKCASRGVRCSGLGTRYRFREDVFTGQRNLRPHRTARIDGNGNQDVSPNYARSQQNPTVDDGWDCDSTITTTASLVVSSSIVDPCSPTTFDASFENADEEVCSIPISPADAFEPWENYCLIYFADRIAPEMVVIDDHHNGWRHLVLPIARVDGLVRAAVLSTSTFHFSANVTCHLFDPSAMQQVVIQKLRLRQDLQAQDLMGQQAVILTLLLLLTAVLVGGQCDFHETFQLMETALHAIGGEEALAVGEFGSFLVKQIRKFRGYAAPLVSQEMGVSILSQTALVRPSSSNGWECFQSYYQLYPNLSKPMLLIYDLHEQACRIYMARVVMGSDGPPLTHLVEKFRTTMEALAVCSSREHNLVWATTMAAGESQAPEHRRYFGEILMRQYQRTGFGYMLTALQFLQSVWRAEATQDWTKLLPSLRTFIL